MELIKYTPITRGILLDKSKNKIDNIDSENSEIESFLQKHSNLKKIRDLCKDKPLEKYYHKIYNTQETSHKKDTLFSNLITNKIITIFEDTKYLQNGEIDTQKIKEQLQQTPILSNADHHGLLNHTVLLNSNLLYSDFLQYYQKKYIITLATGNIPIKNPSFPRGFFFKNEKFNFFRSKDEKTPVFLLENKIHLPENGRLDDFILNLKDKKLTQHERDFLHFLFFEKLEIQHVSKCYSGFSDQITFLNFKLWQLLFNSTIRKNIPNLIYLENNSIFRDYLTTEINKPDSFLSLILFDQKIRKVFLNNFNNIPGCWGENFGSQLFRGISGKKTFINLTVDEKTNSLVGKGFNLKIERETIIQALENKLILPTLFFDFLILTFIEGFIALGGFNQIEYLSQMQTAHVKTLRQIGMNDLAESFETRVTDALICGLLPFKYNSAIDMIWEKNSVNGKFNGNLDNGLSREELDRVLQTKMKDLIEEGIEEMMKYSSAR